MKFLRKKFGLLMEKMHIQQLQIIHFQHVAPGSEKHKHI